MNRTWLLISFILITGIFSFFLHSCGPAGSNTSHHTVSPDTAAINALVKRASAYSQTNYDSMHILADSARRLADAIHYSQGVAKARAVEANCQRRRGNYTDAVAISLEVINAYDSLDLWREKVHMQNILADTYKEMGDQKGVIEFLQKGLELSRKAQLEAEERKYLNGVVISLNQQGIILRDLSKRTARKDFFDTAFAAYQRAISIVEKTGEGQESLGKLYNNISQVYNERFADYTKALEYSLKAVAYNKERNNLGSLTFNYNNISDIYMRMDDYVRAKEYAHRMLAVCKELEAPHRMVNAYGQLTRIAKRMKQYDSALYYKELNVLMADSLGNVEKSGQIAEMQAKYEAKEKESQIFLLSESNRAQSQRIWQLGGAALLLAVLTGVFVGQNRRLSRQKKKIVSQSERLEWMMKELHHRVKNNLQIVSSLLSLQTYRLKDEESLSAIKESQLRVQAMSLIHQRLYQVQDVSMVNFKLYLDDLTETLMKAYGYGPDEFDLSVNIDNELLDVDTVMPMGLLVNEILTNSFKYAYKDVSRPLLTITMKSGDRQLQLTIADNGPGLNAAETGNSRQGFGKKLIDALTKQLKAGYTVNSEQGTVYSFTIPYSKEKAA